MFQAPKVKKGEMVAWHMNGVRTKDWTPAIVMQVNHDNIEVLVLVRNHLNLLARDGVRHVDDPRAQQLRDQTIHSGVWEKLGEAQERDMKEQARKEEQAKEAAKQPVGAK